MHARVFVDTKRIALVLLLLVLLVGIMFLEPSLVLAQDDPAEVGEAAEAAGRDLGLRDWLDHLPLALGSALLVIVVDALFIVKIIRDRRKLQGPA